MFFQIWQPSMFVNASLITNDYSLLSTLYTQVISENKLKRLSQFPIILSLNLNISQFIEWAKDDYFSAKYRLYILFYSAYVRL